MGKLATAQANMIARLTGDAFFTTVDDTTPGVKVPVISKTRGDVAAAIDEALANSGAGLVVLFINAKRSRSAGRIYWVVKWALSAIENPLAKDDGVPTAEDIVEKAAALLDGFPNGVSPNDESEAGRFRCDPNAVDPLDLTGAKRPELAGLNVLVLSITTTIILN